MNFPPTYPQPSPEERASVPPDAAKVVLLVDDNMELRAAMRDFMVASGLQVLEARNAYDAMFLCAQYGPRIDLLLTEINILPVGGIKLGENVLRLWPHVQIVAMSESFDAPGIAYWMRYLGAQFLRKPFTPLELHERVHAALGRAPAEMPLPPVEHMAAAKSSQFWERPAENSPARSSNQDPTFWMQEI